MAKITFSDIVTLAKVGYTPAMVKELLTLETEKKEDEPEAKKDTKDTEEKKEPEEVIDYKKLYEEEKEKNKKIQIDNTKKDIEPEKVDFSELISGIKDALY